MSVDAMPVLEPRKRRDWRDQATWTTVADVFAILAVLTLPWSTTLPGIFVPCWLGAMAWVMDWRAFARFLAQPICYLPLALAGLAAVGTLWSDAAWGTRFYALGHMLKLLVLPGLFYHFERSSRGMWVFIAFLVSCVLLMIVSWLVAIEPSLSLKAPGEAGGRGIFVKNYIAQSQEFALCAVALAYPIIRLVQAKRLWLALMLGAISLGFILNMSFVIVSRTAMVTIPIMLAVFAVLHLKWRTSLLMFAGLAVIAALAFATSPQLQQTVNTFSRDYRLYTTENVPTALGLRLEFWKKSLRFFAEAPVIGHGTGSTQRLFERAATGSTVSATGQIINNPHNQTLNIAVQWGIAGIILLYAMWWVHLRLFRGDGLVAWIGLLVVVQNIFTSLFNSHISDFHEGWMYVLGVGVAGGMVLRARSRDEAREPPEIVRP
ncbi:O-antigen ligase family protein [Bradyrhizobium sp. WSM 1738]|uniref:O-antigen ligase family protein n=1 Tax=Bradyrhizobium hereditatis TaxID=2821405 RepID=UPI001CE382B2|nr:O-antigen ligase family protein [Bradyrhizobium hereditatis]MCA6117738.1 O-antigen ligase family protein [Bradyrhizobium hereditatis]